ncbi:acyltransferase [uncultured Agrococcus sp.]|uniref:acyltransferase family protein n=1 Tax=uncultured Agrococcus sp. TaxID=382258 RepID=UPI0025E8117A|nr:acyltransferase [uncultured Agrococcus sp.]
MVPQRDIPAGRDLTLDLVRVACVLLVVLVHLLLAGVSLNDEGIELEKTLELQSWFNVVSFIFQIMPAFFLVGGFAAMTGWDSLVARRPQASFADNASAFVRTRVIRLARPAVAVLAFFVLALGAAALLGAPADLVDGVAVGVGSPLWFLAAYTIAQALAPWLILAHRSRPVLTLVTLIAIAAAFDALRWLTGNDYLGVPNVAFVWLSIHQLGFWYRDGWFANKRAWQLLAIVAAAYTACIGLVWAGPYSWNMLENQFPATVPLVLLGVAQGALLALAKRPLTALMRTRWAQGAVFLTGTRLMTIYLWHLPVIMAVVGVQLLMPQWLSDPGSARWWLERIPIYAVVLGAVYLLSLALVRLESPPADAAQSRILGLPVALLSVLAFITGPMLIMVFDLSLVNAAIALIGCVIALLLLSGRAPGARRQRRRRDAATARETA